MCLVTQSCLTLCDHMNYSPSGENTGVGSEIIQEEKDRYHMMSPICKISKIQQTKEANSYTNETKQNKKEANS